MGPRPRHGGPWHLRDTATPPPEAGHPILPSPQGPLPQLGHPATCPTQGPAPGPHPACRSTPGQALSPSPCPQGPQGGDDTDLRVPVDPAAAGPPGGTLRQSTAQCTTLGRGRAVRPTASDLPSTHPASQPHHPTPRTDPRPGTDPPWAPAQRDQPDVQPGCRGVAARGHLGSPWGAGAGTPRGRRRLGRPRDAGLPLCLRETQRSLPAARICLAPCPDLFLSPFTRNPTN